jgi:hypothetical protein
MLEKESWASARWSTASLRPTEPPIMKAILLLPYVASLSISFASFSEDHD